MNQLCNTLVATLHSPRTVKIQQRPKSRAKDMHPRPIESGFSYTERLKLLRKKLAEEEVSFVFDLAFFVVVFVVFIIIIILCIYYWIKLQNDCLYF